MTTVEPSHEINDNESAENLLVQDDDHFDISVGQNSPKAEPNDKT
jgi:Tfp pilus assembly protein PilO